MDAKTQGLVGFDLVREHLSRECTSTMGKELSGALEPYRDFRDLGQEHYRVEEMGRVLGRALAPQLGDLRDVRLALRRAALGSQLTIDELLDVARTMDCTGQTYRWKVKLDGESLRLIEFLAPLDDLGAHAKSIHGCIDTRGHVLDMASPELAAIRRQIHDLDEKSKSIMNRFLRDPEIRRILRFQQVSVVGDHQVLAVSVNHRHKIPGFVHRSSSSGDTVFVEPTAVASLAAQRSLLREEEGREVARVLRRLSAEVSKVAGPLGFAMGILAKLDLILAKARWGRLLNMVRPHLNQKGLLILKEARHPLIEVQLRTESERLSGDENFPGSEGRSEITKAANEVVPISLQLGQTGRLMIITGPNTGGKTASLKTAGLICFMALSGMPIPASRESTIPFLDGIYADIGEEQSLSQSLSSFSSHIARIAWILPKVGPGSLVLLDELGTGTDPAEGAAMGRAILDELSQRNCLGMVTTHLGDLKRYSKHNPAAVNAAVEFDPETLLPTFRLLMGRSGKSNALKIARRFHLPEELIKRARYYLGIRKKARKKSPDTSSSTVSSEIVQNESVPTSHQMDEFLAEERARELERSQKDKEIREADARQKLTLARSQFKNGDWVEIPKFGQPGQICRVDQRKKVAMVQVGLGQWEMSLDELWPKN